MMKLTEHLTSLDVVSYKLATQHPFLQAAGDGTLSPKLLSLWLAQDRIYAAHAYPRFVGTLLSKIAFSTLHPIGSPNEIHHQRITKILSFALENVVREASFFDDAARRWGLKLGEWRERMGTRNYTAEMARIGAHESLEMGLVFLWAMEKVYLDAWAFVKQQKGTSLGGTKAANSRSEEPAALDEFVANWTSPEFIEFVNELRDLVDCVGILPGTDDWRNAERVWSRVVELEQEFWPEIGEAGTDELR